MLFICLNDNSRFSAAKVQTYYITAIEKRLITLLKCCNITLPGKMVIPGNVRCYFCNASTRLAYGDLRFKAVDHRPALAADSTTAPKVMPYC